MTALLLLEEDNLISALRNNYLFRGLTKDVVAGIAAMAERRHYRGGETLVRQFEHSHDLLIILEGSARIKSTTDEALAEFGPGSMIGEISLIDDQPRSATVIANGETEVAIIPQSAIQSFMQMDPEVSSVIMGNIARVLCRRMRSMNLKVEALAVQEKPRWLPSFWPTKRSA